MYDHFTWSLQENVEYGHKCSRNSEFLHVLLEVTILQSTSSSFFEGPILMTTWRPRWAQKNALRT